MNYLLDTNIGIALLKGSDKKLIEEFQKHLPSAFHLCSVVKAELLYGACKSERVKENLDLLDRFFSQFRSIPFDDNCAEFYGKIRSLLTKAGTPIGANDLFIASIAQTNKLTLITRNRSEFDRIPGIEVETW